MIAQHRDSGCGEGYETNGADDSVQYLHFKHESVAKKLNKPNAWHFASIKIDRNNDIAVDKLAKFPGVTNAHQWKFNPDGALYLKKIQLRFQILC